VELDPEQTRHIDYGCTVESVQHPSPDSILLAEESSQLAEQQTAPMKLKSHTRKLVIYTTNSSEPLQKAQGPLKLRLVQGIGFRL
jgi:hypothetical protein